MSASLVSLASLVSKVLADRLERPAAKVSRALQVRVDLVETLAPPVQLDSLVSRVHRDQRALPAMWDNQDSKGPVARWVLLASLERVVTAARLVVLDNRVTRAQVETKV